MRKIILVMAVTFAFLSCSGTKGFTESDEENITLCKWLYKEGYSDHFLCFREDGSGWEAKIENAAAQMHPYFTKNDFTYQMDTYEGVLEIVSQGSDISGFFPYRFFEERGHKYFELDGIRYIDGQDEINRFQERLQNTVEPFVEALGDIVEALIQN